MSLVFKELTLRNFLSYGNVEQTIKLDNKHFQIITGKNLDKSNDEDNKNAVGKSSLYQALNFAIRGKSIGNKVNLGTLVNNINKKNMSVTLTFEKNGVEYRIERGRSPNFLRFYKNNEEVTIDESLGDSRDTQAEIDSVIGMTDDVFSQIVLLTCSVPLFLDQTTSKQKEIIEKILGVDIISEKIDSLKSLIKETKNSLNNELFKYNTVKESNENLMATINKQIDDMNIAKSNRLSKINSDIESYSSMLTTLSNIDYDSELEKVKLIEDYNKRLEVINTTLQLKNNVGNKIKSNEDKINSLSKELEKIKSFDFVTEKQNHTYNNSLQVEIANYKAQESIYKVNLSNLNNEKNNFKKLVSKIESKELEISNFKDDVCPTCGQKVNEEVTKEFKDKLSNELSLLKEEMNASDLKIMELNNEVQSFIPQSFELKPTTYKSLDDVYKIESSIKNYEDMIDMLKKDNETLKTQYDSIQIETLGEKPVSIFKSINEVMTSKANLDSIKTTIESLKSQLLENPFEQQEQSIEQMKANLVQIDDSEIIKLENEQKHQELLLKLLSSPSSFIRKTILDKSLEFLNTKIGQYLASLGSLHTVTFNNDMSISITSMGLDYSYVSSGEEGRINIALMLAFRDVWETLNNCPTNLMMIDELIDRLGLDVAGKDMFVSSLKALKNKNIMVVTHDTNLINNCDNIITIIKENGFSDITYNY